jgi:hypothetical protein
MLAIQRVRGLRREADPLPIPAEGEVPLQVILFSSYAQLYIL